MMGIKKVFEEVRDTIQLIENDVEYISAGIELINIEIPSDFDTEKIDDINLKKIEGIPEDIRNFINQIGEQVDVLEENIIQLKKLKIIEALKDKRWLKKLR